MPSSYKRIYVGKLPRDVTDRELRRHFDEFGRIREVRILVGFAFVEYDDPRDARDAVEKLDGSRFLGERILVEASKVQRDDRNRESRDSRDRDQPRGARGTGKNRLKVENLPSRISWQ
ncbi:putative splicing factor, arginine/serine-rich 6, partial [Podochytrium sp. JEL0797]